MLLTGYIVSASDGCLLLGAIELPDLRVATRSLDGLAQSIEEEAARLTGRPAEHFKADMVY